MVDAEHVHLERVPPLVRVGERIRRPGDARVAHEQVDVADLRCPALDVLSLRHVADKRAAVDLPGDVLDLFRGAPGDRHLHARVGELARDVLADPTSAARDEGDSRKVR